MESGAASAGYVAERLDHLGIVAGVCREIGLAEWLDEQDTQSHERVSMGTATVAMILNGLGFSNRRLYLVPQFFATNVVAQEARRKAAFLVATNALDPTRLSDQELSQTYKDQHSVERGFAFLKDPLFLASSVFVNKPEWIVALALVMVLCLLVHRLAEHRLRQQLSVTSQTIPSQVNKPTDRPTTRWVFQCFEGVDLLHIRHGPGPDVALVLWLQPFTSRC